MDITQAKNTDMEMLRYLWVPELDPLFWRGVRSGVISAWYGHVPFAHWIIGALKPRLLVELGTHNGVSYSTFCEAIVRNGLDTRCYAVDTWQGDDQSGHYGEEVYRDLRRFHDERYSAFSELLRCTFDEALAYIPDNAIDLLHIDGLHTYEAVRHDFESWRPKLSDNGVVLFHDTNVREGDFGVFRLWEELHTQFPSFEFLHGHGLGVLAVGHSVPALIATLCSLTDPVHVNAIRQRFSLLGERFIALHQRDELEQSTKAELAARNSHIAQLEEMIRQIESQAAERTRQIESQAAERTRQIESQAAERIRQTESQAVERIRQFEEMVRQIESQGAERIRQFEEQSARQVAELNAQVAEARRVCSSMIGSLSWKVTAPLRFLRDTGVAGLSKLRRPVTVPTPDGKPSLDESQQADALTLPHAANRSDRRTALMLIHEASRTGAPILGWNIARALSDQVNIVTVLLKGGPLEEVFADVATVLVGPLDNAMHDPAEAARLAHRLVEVYRPSYVIANSAATAELIPGLADAGVPVIALVHEFSSRMPPGSLGLLYERASEIVFPADIVRRASEKDYPFLKLRRTNILAQGQSEVPRSGKSAPSPQQGQGSPINKKLRPSGAENDLVVVGMGFIEWRKGIDLFIATATSILADQTNSLIRFVWIGDGYHSPIAIEVSSYLEEQIARSGLGNRFKLVGAVDDIESIYDEADILFLSSRLDPLPNVSIDATLHGIPVVCFAEASGMAEILSANDDTRELVVPHLDVAAAAALISSLAIDRNRLKRLGDAVRELARTRFDMSAYVRELDNLGRRARESAEQEEADAALILAERAFDTPLYLGERGSSVELSAAVSEYSRLAAKYNYARAPRVHQAMTRRPLAGFHPVTYALQNPDYDSEKGGDPLAHYLRSGKPNGPWVHPVLRIEGPEDASRLSATPEAAKLRVVLHGHFHYTDHFDDFRRALAANKQPYQLILTTNSEEKAAELRSALGNTPTDVRVVPNRGRDIGPFLTVLKELMDSCDLLGHIHGKRTPHAEQGVGDRWRVFLWQHLVGDATPMADIIRQGFMKEPGLGLVFPEDPHLVMWDENLEIAQEFATRMVFHEPLPPSFECPVGTMFWARPAALAPLLRLGLTSDDYPPEPLPIDGTMLHALERLIPLVVQEAGYRYATTYLPRFVR